jgi:hypothetical protein
LVQGTISGYARYVKVVDADEVTVSFVQEIFDDNNQLIGTHTRYSEDTSHQDLMVPQEDEQ